MMLVMMKEMKEEVDGVTLILIDAAHDDEKEYDDGHLLIQLKAFSQAVHPSLLQDMGMLAVCRKAMQSARPGSQSDWRKHSQSSRYEALLCPTT